MTNEFRGPELVRDDDLTRELRAIYSAPSDASWWAGLERRINARIDAAVAADEWWTVPDRWLRVGLIAGGLRGDRRRRADHALADAGRAAWRTRPSSTPATADLLEVAERGNADGAAGPPAHSHGPSLAPNIE